MTTLRTQGGSLTMADGVLEVVHAGVIVLPVKKAASPLRFPIEAVERVQHIEQGLVAGGHLRVHLVGDDRPHGKVSDDVRTSQLKYLRADGQRDVGGFVHAVNQAAAAAGERPWVWPAPAGAAARACARGGVPRCGARHPLPAPSAAAFGQSLKGDVVDPPPAAAAPVRERSTATDLENRSPMRLLRVAEFATWVQLALLLLPIAVFIAVFIFVVVVVF